MITVFPSAARTATANSADKGSENFQGGTFVLDITAVSGTTPSMTVKIQHKDGVSGQYIDIPGCVFAAKTATGTDSLQLFSGITPAANRSVAGILGDEFRAVATITGTTPSFTFSLSLDGVR